MQAYRSTCELMTDASRNMFIQNVSELERDAQEEKKIKS
jgi:hypothetical protein